MEELYYTPKIEELFVGYKCEITYAKNEDDIYWIPTILTLWDINTILEEKEGNFRTKYLDKEDIINEGWIHKNDNVFIKEYIYKDEDDEFTGFHYKLYLHKNNCITIEKLNINTYTGKPYYDLYEGNQNHIVKNIKCKSINEFKKIIEWIYQ